MRAAGLLLVFVLAKAIVLASHSIALSWWSPIAYLWQDAAVVLAFAVVESYLGSRVRAAWTLYAVLALYAAINVPVARTLSTPLTWPMLRAAGGPLADSIWHYATPANFMALGAVLAAAVLGPFIQQRISRPRLVLALVPCVILGPVAVARVDTLGLERNPWIALLTTAMPRVTARPAKGDWRATAIGDAVRHENLSRFYGAAAGRNVVLISLESTAAQYLGLYRANPEVMPNLSKLASMAIVFDNAYAVYPESIKGLFSILCSTYPAFDSSTEIYAKARCQSMAAIMSGAGYRTALFHSGRFQYLGMEAVIRNRGFHKLADAGDIGGNRESSFGIDEPSTVTAILTWIDALAAGQRFFITYLPIAGHHPYETPEPGPFPGNDEFGRYRNALHYGDAALGRLIDGLRARGLEQKTIWVILGDHGEAFGQHEGNYGHTFHLYEENVRVPFLIAAPGLIHQQIRGSQVISLLDTAPTVLDLLGMHVPEGYQGSSVLDGEPRMALFFADYSLGILGLRDGPWKFLQELGHARSKLFNLDQDPQEKANVSNLHPDLTRVYGQRLRGWSAAQKHLIGQLK